MEEATCKKCGMPMESDADHCSCKPELCIYCCECGPECTCGCQSK